MLVIRQKRIRVKNEGSDFKKGSGKAPGKDCG